NNVTVDFKNQPFYVYSATGSTINVNSNSQAGRLTVQNVNLQNSGSSNTASWIGSKYYTTNKGILFSSTQINGPTATSPTIVYKNINYNFPGDLTYNQPLTTNSIPVEFQGTNNFVTGTTSNQLAQIPNIKVTSGTTTMTGNGANTFPYGLINNTNNQAFPIEIANGATLNLTSNSSRGQMFNFWNNNPLQINNSGTLNLNDSGTSDVFKGVNGVDLTNNGQVNLTAYNSIFNSSSMGTVRVNMDLSSNSQTVLASTNNAPFSNFGSWGSGSLIKFHPNAKFLSYSGMTYSAGGLTNSLDAYVPVEFIDSGSGSNGYKTNQVPTNVDSYKNLTPISSKYNSANKVISSSDLSVFDANALTLSGKLAFADNNPNTYNWDYSLDKLPTQTGFLPRTSGDNLSFNVIDSISNKAKFQINATYKPNQTNQPFTMWFVNQKQQNQLNQSAQTILTSDQMDKNGDNCQKNFTNDQGLVIKTNNKAKSGQYSGVVDWTLQSGI
ncbi:cell surface protein, partial [Fructilactobacillus sanfranciscensis]|uniref:cell surface protein n=2 Tax=Fructilactobacillus sanfranciscensis TaxID=1625 RepID=UPI0013D4F6B7